MRIEQDNTRFDSNVFCCVINYTCFIMSQSLISNHVNTVLINENTRNNETLEDIMRFY